MPMIGIGLDLSGQGSVGAAELQSETIHSFLPTNENTLVGRTHVLVFDVDALEIPDFDVSGVQLLVAGRVDKIYIGPAAPSGDPYDRASNVTITFGGQAGVNQAFDATTLSDVVDFTWDKTSNLVITFYIAAGNTATDVTTGVDWYDVNGFDVAANNDIDGANLILSGAVANVAEIIVYGS